MQTMQSITLGKVEGSIEALHAALQKLEEGDNLEDAKAVCEPGLLNQITKWKSKLRVYLSPFLNGMRYTSFGQHFTKVDKLQERWSRFEEERMIFEEAALRKFSAYLMNAFRELQLQVQAAEKRRKQRHDGVQDCYSIKKN